MQKRNAVGDVNRENRSRNRSVQIGYRRIASDANMDARNNEEFDDDDEVSEPETDVTNNFGMAEILLKRTRWECYCKIQHIVGLLYAHEPLRRFGVLNG